MRLYKLSMFVAMVFTLAVMLFSVPSMSHAELPPGGGDVALMSLSDTMSTPSAMILADKAMSLADADLITTSAVAARTREHTFNLPFDNTTNTMVYPLRYLTFKTPDTNGNRRGGWRTILLA